MSEQAEKSVNYGKYPIRTGILFLLAAASVGLSMYGDTLSCKPPQLLDSLLKSAAYLTLNGFEPITGDDPGNTQVRLARILALAFVIVAAGTLLDSVFHFWTNFKRWMTSRKPHHLVIGLGWHGRALLLDKANSSITIAIDPNPGPIAREICERKGIPLLAIDACGSEVFRLVAELNNTERVFIAAGSDDLNIRIAHHLANGYSGKSKIDFAVCLETDKSTQTLISVLGDKESIGLHTFNNVGSTAQALFSSDEYCVDRWLDSANTRKAHIVLIGDGPMGKELLRHSLQHCIFENDASLHVSVLWPECREFSERWGAEHPCFMPEAPDRMPIRYEPKVEIWLKENVLPSICFHEAPVSARGWIDWCESNVASADSVTTVIIAMQDPSDTCRIIDWIGAKLTELATSSVGIEVWVYFNSPEEKLRKSMLKKMKASYETLNPKVFYDYLDKFNRDFAIGKNVDDVAKRVNAMYAVDGIEKKEPVEAQQASIDKFWLETNENDKDSSRQSAVHAFIKKRIKERFKGKLPCDEESKQLAEIEHRRWCAEYLLNGFEPLTRNVPLNELTEVEKVDIDNWFDIKKKKQEFKAIRFHVDLVPYHDLVRLLGDERGKKEQDKDRVIVLNDWVLTGSPESVK